MPCGALADVQVCPGKRGLCRGRRQRKLQEAPGPTLGSGGQLLRRRGILVIYQLAQGQGQVLLADNKLGGRSLIHSFIHSLIHLFIQSPIHQFIRQSPSMDERYPIPLEYDLLEEAFPQRIPNICNSSHSKRLISLVNKELLQIIKENKQANRNLGKGYEQTTHKKGVQRALRPMTCEKG